LLLDERGDPKIATYSGRGPLDGWLRVVLARTALTLLRRRSVEPVTTDETDLLSRAVASDNQEMAVLRQRCGPMLKRALEEAVAALTDGDRTLLRLHTLDGMTIDDLAVVYGAHRTTLGRRIARVRSALFRSARAKTMESLGIGETEFQSLVGLVGSGLDVTLARILGDGAPPVAEGPRKG
jgi:RNA polymerase sigma-70 factor (ECF subfamily)